MQTCKFVITTVKSKLNYNFTAPEVLRNVLINITLLVSVSGGINNSLKVNICGCSRPVSEASLQLT